MKKAQHSEVLGNETIVKNSHEQYFIALESFESISNSFTGNVGNAGYYLVEDLGYEGGFRWIIPLFTAVFAFSSFYGDTPSDLIEDIFGYFAQLSCTHEFINEFLFPAFFANPFLQQIDIRIAEVGWWFEGAHIYESPVLFEG